MPAHPDFFDEAVISVSSGRGGDGSVHFRREKFVPMGGPDGGDGGDGASVILEADATINTLQNFRYQRRFAAEAGSPGAANRRHGRQARDLVVKVPAGTVVLNGETQEFIADLKSPGDRLEAAHGGQGGLGNSHFATSTRQAPNFAEKGQPGEERNLRLELKLVADVGLVGLPNAGKSTLLAAMSAARPKIADYPFTTLVPNLGVVATDDFSFVVADIPGLIEGAHEGHGLGDRFLRHIERTRVLVRVLDASSSSLRKDFDQVTGELRLYDSALLALPCIVALNKMDLPDARRNGKRTEAWFEKSGFHVIPTSGATHEGINLLIGAMARVLESARGTEESNQPQVNEIVYQLADRPEDFTVERKRSTFYVFGQAVERIVSMTDMESGQALERLQRQLKRLGVVQALQREGIRAGAKVNIGGYELVWEGEIEPGVAAGSASTRVGQTTRGSRRRIEPGTRASRGRRPH